MKEFKKGFRFGWKFADSLNNPRSTVGNIFRSWGAKARKFDSNKESADLERLYNETLEIFEQSKLGSIEPSILAVHIVEEALDLAHISVSGHIVSHCYDVISECLQSEGFWYPPSKDILQTQDAIERAETRIHLRGLKKIYSSADEKLNAIIGALLDALTIVFKSIDASLLQNSNEKITVPLIEVLPNTKTVTHNLINSFYQDELHETLIFEKLRTQFERNTIEASGMHPDYPDTHTKQWIFPEESKLDSEAVVPTYLANTPFEKLFYTPLPISIPDSIRAEHALILAGTGHGKTQLLQKMIVDDLEAGRGFMVIDSQGDLINNIAMLDVFSPSHPNSLADKLVIIDPNDIEYPIALNLFALNEYDEQGLSARDKEIVFNASVEMYTYLFGALFGSEMTQRQNLIFTYLARLMLEIPDANIHTFRELLTDGKQYIPYMNKLTGTAKAFFKEEYFSSHFASTKKQVLRRLWGVFANQTLERLFSAKENKVDLANSINEGKIILVNTAKALLRQEGSAVLGRFFIALLTQATLLRSRIPANERTLWNCYIDEAQDYIDEKVESQLEQARKYQVGMTIAHQSLSQLSHSTRASVLTNTTSKWAGGVNNQDARTLAQEMRTTYEKISEVNKRKNHTEYALYIKNILPNAVKVDVPFGVMEDLPSMSLSDYQQLITQNREKYCYTPEIYEQEDIAIQEKTIVKSKTEEKVVEASVIEEAQEKAIKRTVTPYLEKKKEGKGGSVHTYMQSMVRKIGQRNNFKVSLEKSIGGKKSIDAVLAKENIEIALELSVTTNPKHELGNIQKCVDAGYVHIMMMSSEAKHLRNIKNYCKDNLDNFKQVTIKFLLLDELEEYLQKFTQKPKKKEQTIAGYKVKTNYIKLSEEDEHRKKMAIAKVLLNKE